MELNRSFTASACASRDELYRFGEFELDLYAIELRKSGQAVALTTKSLDVLVYLVRNRDRPVSRSELLSRLWPNVRVATGSLTQAIWEIRRALGDDPTGARFIRTLRGRGYRFAGRVESILAARPRMPDSSAPGAPAHVSHPLMGSSSS